MDRYEVVIGGETLVVTSLPADGAEGLEALSAAEREVAVDAAGGMSNAAIAQKRNRAVRTVANQLASVYRKLGLGSRAELAVVLHGRR